MKANKKWPPVNKVTKGGIAGLVTAILVPIVIWVAYNYLDMELNSQEANAIVGLVIALVVVAIQSGVAYQAKSYKKEYKIDG